MKMAGFDLNRLSYVQWQLLFFYCASAAYLCDGFVSFFLRGIIPFWRQLIVAAGLWFLLEGYNRFFNAKGRNFLLIIGCCAGWLVLRGVVTYFELGFNVVRLAYALVLGICGIPFFLFPALLVHQRHDPRNLFRFFAWLGAFFGAGLIIDGLTGGFFVCLKEEVLADGVKADDLFRYSFLAQIISTFGVMSVFCVTSSLYMVYWSRLPVQQLIYFGCGLLIAVGSWYSGSRQITLPALASLALGVVGYVLFVRRSKVVLTVALVLGTLFAAGMLYQFLVDNSNDETVDRYTIDSLAEDDRSYMWSDGAKAVLGDPLVFLFGKGLAYASGQRSLPHEALGFHYENSYYSRGSETGFGGLMLLLMPCIFVFHQIIRARRRHYLDWLAFLFMGNYLFISYISPNGLHFTSQAMVYLMAGVYCFRSYFTWCTCCE
jgi:hypothetical protein